MQPVPFWNSLSFNDPSPLQLCTSLVDGYFRPFGGDAAHVFVSHDARNDFVMPYLYQPPFILTCFKLASYCLSALSAFSVAKAVHSSSKLDPLRVHWLRTLTGIFPIVMLALKVVLRSLQSYEISPQNSRHSKATDRPSPADKAKPIDLSVIDTLGLPLEEVWQIDKSIFQDDFQKHLPPLTSFKTVATKIITAINTQLTSSLRSNSVTIQWLVNSDLYYYDQYFGVPSQPLLVSLENTKNTWFYRTLQALVDKGHIQSFERLPSRGGYTITL
jgi:hypothetical protein